MTRSTRSHRSRRSAVVALGCALSVGAATLPAIGGDDPCGSLAEIARFDAAFIADFELFEDYLAVYLSEGLESNFVHLYDAHALPALELHTTIELPAASNGVINFVTGPGSGWIEIDEDRVYVQTIPFGGSSGERLAGWDISNPASPEYLGSVAAGPTDHNVYRDVYYAIYDDDGSYVETAGFADFPNRDPVWWTESAVSDVSPFYFSGDYVLTAGGYYDSASGQNIAGLITSRLPGAGSPPGAQSEERVAILRSEDFDLPGGFRGFTPGDGLAVVGNYNSDDVLVVDITDLLDVRPRVLLADQQPLAFAATSRLIGIERGVAYVPPVTGLTQSPIIELDGPNAGRQLGQLGLLAGEPARVRNRTLIHRVAPADGETTGPSAVVLYDLGECGLCPADLVTPWRTLDLADITAFVAGFVGTDPQSDLNDDGVWDLGDVQLFVASFNAGC